MCAWHVREAMSAAGGRRRAGIGVGRSGLTLPIACLFDWVGGMFWSNVFLVALILAWLAGVGLSSSASSPS